MKGNFEVHHGSLDLIQPNDIPWDHFNQIGYQTPHHHLINIAPNQVPLSSAPTVVLGDTYSNFMDRVSRHITSDTSLYEFSVDDASVSTDKFLPPVAQQAEYRPRKAPRRDYGSKIGHASVTIAKPVEKNDEHGLNLITLLLECAVAISVDNLSDANLTLLELTQLASPYAPSCAERVVAYFTKAMASRVMNSYLAISSPLVPHKSILSSFQAFNNVSPFIKFSHFTANQAILEAFHQENQVHIIDLDIMQGLQWPALFHILSTRPDGPPHVRMTGLGASIDALQETGNRLSNFAKRLNMQFEFMPIARKFGDLDPSMIQTRCGEAVSVHWLQHSLYDAIGSDHNMMRLLEALNPRVITLVEQELIHAGSFLDRFVGSLHYYSTLFDSLGATLTVDDLTRHRVENGLLSREISNILAVGGPARSGEEKFASWRTELGRRLGFVQVRMSSNAMAQAQLILNMFPPSLGYTIMQGDGTLRLGWKDTGLYMASAWTSRLGREILMY